MSGEKITREEMIALFGEAMPLEAAKLLFDADGGKTIGAIRDELRTIARQTSGAHEQRNARVQSRYDELMRMSKHGHYETLFQVVREEVFREREACAQRLDAEADALLDGQSPKFAQVCSEMAAALRARR